MARAGAPWATRPGAVRDRREAERHGAAGSETRPSTASLSNDHPTVILDKVLGRHNHWSPALHRVAD